MIMELTDEKSEKNPEKILPSDRPARNADQANDFWNRSGDSPAPAITEGPPKLMKIQTKGGAIVKHRGTETQKDSKPKDEQKESKNVHSISSDSGRKITIAISYSDYVVLVDMLRCAAKDLSFIAWARICCKIADIEGL